MANKYSILFLLSFGLNVSSVRAQESMMTDVSYLFLEKLIATAKENYPRINAFKAREAISKSQITSQKSAWLDGLSFSYVYAPNNTLNLVNQPGTTSSFFNGYQAALSFSVTSLFQKSSAVKQAKEELKLVKYDEEEYLLTLESQVKARYFAYVQQMITLRLSAKAYADALSLNKDASNKYSKGELTFSDYLQAQIALTNVTTAKIATEANFLTSKAALEELLTKKIEEIQ